MKLIKFTHVTSNKPVYINPDKLTFIAVNEEQVVLTFDFKNQVWVKETEDEVIFKLYGTQLDPLTRTGNYDRL